jgi:hypothetical protein
MGGRGTAGKNKVFSVIDAQRNKPFRDARAKEIAEDKKSLPTEIPNGWTKMSLRERAAHLTGQSVESLRASSPDAIRHYLNAVGTPLAKSLASDIGALSKQGKFITDSDLFDRRSPFSSARRTPTAPQKLSDSDLKKSIENFARVKKKSVYDAARDDFDMPAAEIKKLFGK